MKSRLILASAAALATGLFALGCALRPPPAPLPTVQSVDLPSYMGDWYEQAKLPNRFQSQCVSDTQARYSLRDDGKVRVLNRCRTASGKVDEIEGVAHAAPDSGNAKLRVSFFRPFYGDYWVLAFGPDKRWVLLGEPSRDYAWVLSRSPALPPAELEAALGKAAELGFERGKFTRTPQTQPLD